MTLSPNLESRHYRHPAVMPLPDYVARLKDCIAQGDEASVDYLLKQFRINDDGAVSICPREGQS